jgi:hypothetical protein
VLGKTCYPSDSTVLAAIPSRDDLLTREDLLTGRNRASAPVGPLQPWSVRARIDAGNKVEDLLSSEQQVFTKKHRATLVPKQAHPVIAT